MKKKKLALLTDGRRRNVEEKSLWEKKSTSVEDNTSDNEENKASQVGDS